MVMVDVKSEESLPCARIRQLDVRTVLVTEEVGNVQWIGKNLELEFGEMYAR